MRRAPALLAALTTAALAAPSAAAAAPDDEHWDLQWGPRQIQAEPAWATSTGDGVTIAIVDSGVDRDHPDLAQKVVGGATFVGCADEPAGCGDGDWDSGGKAAGEPDPHGTHVAGIAAAVTGNGTGIAGVAPDADLLAVKVLGEEGGTFEEIAAGIRWAVRNGADVVNLSLGAAPGVQVLTTAGVIADVQEAIAEAREAGVVVVAAAGNDFASVCGTPAWDDGALCVTATDPDELRAAYSNFGVKPGMDVVAAPGGRGFSSCEDDILSTVPAEAESDACGIGGGYDFYAGTSMAAPHVSGVAALLAAQGRDDDETLAVLQETARNPVTGARGTYDPVYGHGIVDAEAAVAAPLGG